MVTWAASRTSRDGRGWIRTSALSLIRRALYTGLSYPPTIEFSDSLEVGSSPVEVSIDVIVSDSERGKVSSGTSSVSFSDNDHLRLDRFD